MSRAKHDLVDLIKDLVAGVYKAREFTHFQDLRSPLVQIALSQHGDGQCLNIKLQRCTLFYPLPSKKSSRIVFYDVNNLQS